MNSQPTLPSPSDLPLSLADCPLLKELPPDAIAELEHHAKVLRLPPGRVIFRHNDPSDAVYFVLAGTVRVFFQTQYDQEVNYAQFGPGQVFGELGVIDGGPRSADVVSVTEAVVAMCPSPAFLTAIRHYPDLASAIILRLVSLLRQADQRITSFSTLTAVQRVYLELLRVATPNPEGDGTWVISPAPLHKDIAGWAGTTPDVVGRAIGQLMRANLMRRRGGVLQMTDRRRIEALSQIAAGDDGD